MKLAPIIHQQVVQLKWHLLACVGLMMALPLEDAIVNLCQGQGFYAGSLSLAVPLAASPLLAALLACANVQADFDDRRYTFWRSKPAGIKSWVLLKYVIGLLAAFAIIASPFLFAFFTCRVAKPNEIERGFFEAVIMVQSVSLLTYSLCFLCNVLIRRTARAWLLGMALTGFLMLIPFILPLNLKTIDDVFELLGRKWSFIWVGYCLTGIPSLAALILSVIAAARNWRLHTNLKGLLWAAAAFALILMLLFARQVANIKVLDQKQVDIAKLTDYWGERYLSLYENDRIQIVDNQIRLRPVEQPSPETLQEYRIERNKPMYTVAPELKVTVPTESGVYCRTPNGLYTFKLYTYFKEEKYESQRGRVLDRRSYKKVYLRSFRVVEGLHFPASYLNLSDCLNEDSFHYMIMRVVDNKIIALVGDQCVSIAISDSGDMSLVSKRPVKRYAFRQRQTDKVFKVPLIPAEEINVRERIRFSLDFNFLGPREDLFQYNSIVDDAGEELRFCLVSDNAIERYQVSQWDEEYIYCTFSDARPFTFLEQMFGPIGEGDPYFVKDGRLYACSRQKLLVFDIRSDRIRKLGHFERISEQFSINDVEVLDDGNILIGAIGGLRKYANDRHSTVYDLYLLKNPE